MQATPNDERPLSFLRVFFPLYLEKNVLFIVMLSDVLFIGLTSNDAVAGIGAAIPLVYALDAIVSILGVAVIGIMGRYLGASKKAAIPEVLKAASMIGVTIGALCMIVLLLLSYFLSDLIDLSPAGEKAFVDYLIFISPMLVIDGIFIVCASTVAVHGKTTWLLVASIIFTGTNIILNLLVYLGAFPGVYLDARVIALTTLAAHVPTIGIYLFCIYNVLNVRPKLNSTDRDAFRDIFQTISSMFYKSLPIPLSSSVSQFLIAVFLSRYGTEVLATYVYCKNLIIPIATASTRAFAISIQIIVSRMVGALKLQAAKSYLNRSLLFYIPFVVMGIMTLRFAFPSISEVFNIAPEIQNIAPKMMLVLLVVEVSTAIWLTHDLTLRSIGYILVPAALFFGVQSIIWGGGYFTVFYFELPLDAFFFVIAYAEILFALCMMYIWNFDIWMRKVSNKGPSDPE